MSKFERTIKIGCALVIALGVLVLIPREGVTQAPSVRGGVPMQAVMPPMFGMNPNMSPNMMFSMLSGGMAGMGGGMLMPGGGGMMGGGMMGMGGGMMGM